MKRRVTTSTTENVSEKSPPFGWNMSGTRSRGITSRNETGMNVEDFDRWLYHRWTKGCRLHQSTSRCEEADNLKARFIKCKRSLAAVSNPEEINQRCAT